VKLVTINMASPNSKDPVNSATSPKAVVRRVNVV
jgi:hypothetical protein